jgi:hypothetical protein
MEERAPPPLQVLKEAFGDWWDDWVNWVICSMLLIASWFTVILGPPATLGFYYVANQLTYGRSLGPRGMAEGAWRYFLTAWLWMVVNAVGALFIYANFWFYGQLEGPLGALLVGFSVALLLVWLLVQFYALPYLMEQERPSLFLALRNGLFSLLAFPGYTLILGGLALVIGVLSLRFVVPAVLGAFGFVALLGTRAVRERLETYQIRERGEPEREEARL